MPSIVETIVRSLLVGGVRTLELLTPMPKRLGQPAAAPAGSDPVILISGFAITTDGWSEWKRSLQADGFDVHVVKVPGSGLDDMEAAARAVAQAIERIKRQTGRTRVDIVGFSEGGLLARMYVAQGGAASVDRLVTLATPHGGVAIGGLLSVLRALPLLGGAIPQAADQLAQGSQLLQRIDSGDRHIRLLGPVRYASIFSSGHDWMVSPHSARLEGAANIALNSWRILLPSGPTHFGIYHRSHTAYEAARSLLLT